MVGDSNDETNFPHKLLLYDTQLSSVRKDFANDSSAVINFWNCLRWCSFKSVFVGLDKKNI